jgi:rubrerythrin
MSAESEATEIMEALTRLEFRCVDCGYGIRVRDLPESCPMCHAGSETWQRAAYLQGLGDPIALKPAA